MRELIKKEDWLWPESNRLPDHKTDCVPPRAHTYLKGLSAQMLSGWPSFEPCTAEADGQVLRSDPSVCGTCSEAEPLFRYCPKQYRQRSCAWEDWGEREVLLRHKRVDRVGLRERGPFFPVFQLQEQYGRFPREKCNSVEARFAFRCHL